MKYMQPPLVVTLSGGVKLQVDADELPKLLEGIQSGGVVKVRQGVFNPSYFISITEDSKRVEQFFEYEQRNKGAIEKGEMPPASFKKLRNVLKEKLERTLPEPIVQIVRPYPDA